MASNSWGFLWTISQRRLLLVLMDEHSRFPEVEIIRSTFTPVTIERLEKIFSVHGFPVEFVSDNGPPFNGHGFHNYLVQNGIKHRKITPYGPPANTHCNRVFLVCVFYTLSSLYQSPRTIYMRRVTCIT